MKLEKSTSINNKISAVTGIITWIDWGNNIGMVDLGGEVGEVPCTFHYGGQHWVWNQNSYPTENIDSHSAYAFCIDDLVTVIQEPLPEEEQTEEVTQKYTCVLVLAEDRSSVVKRFVWPLFRNGHRAVVLGAEYSDETYYDPVAEETKNKEAGFPFIDYPTRDLIQPYTDQNGNQRPLGTFIEQDQQNTKLVITFEDDKFIAHPPCEFMSEGGPFNYEPDVLMQTEPNYRGRIVGLSKNNEILIDNIPVAKIVDEGIGQGNSGYEVTHKLIHIDEVNDIVTVLFVTMDFEHKYYHNHAVYQTSGFFPPPYAFAVRKAQATGVSLCVYKAMSDQQASLPVPEISLVTDTASSWQWDDMLGEDYNVGVDYAQYCHGDNLQEDFLVAYYGKDIDLKFYASIPIGENPSTEYYWYFEEVIFKLTTNQDGTYSVQKQKGVTKPSFSGGNFEVSRTTSGDYDLESGGGSIGPGDIDLEVSKAGSNSMRKQIQASGSGNHSMYHPAYYREQHTSYSLSCTEIFTHKSPHGDFEICRSESYISGATIDGVKDTYTPSNDYLTFAGFGTMEVIIFTHIDTRNGIYCYYKMIPWKEVDIVDYRGQWVTFGDPPQSYFVWPSVDFDFKWEHYISHRGGTVLTQEFTRQFPSGTVGTMPEASRLNAGTISGLIWKNGMELFLMTYVPLSYELVTPMIGEHSKVILGSGLPRRKAWNYDGMTDFLWDTTDCTTVDESGCYISGTVSNPDFNIAPFELRDNKRENWPVCYNVGNPHRGVFAKSQKPEIKVPQAVYVARDTVTRTGVQLGPDQYSYYYTVPGTPQQIDSPGLPDIRSCTGRSDLVLKV